MLKELALVALRQDTDRNSALDKVLALSGSVIKGWDRLQVSGVIPSDDPAAVGAMAKYDLVIETWFEPSQDTTNPASSWFERLMPDALQFVDREASIFLVVNEIVLKEPDPKAGVKIVSLLPRNPEMNFEEFLRYWRERHGKIVVSAQEFWRHLLGYVQNHPVQEAATTFGGGEVRGVDGIAQLFFADDEAAIRAFKEPQYLAVVRPDELILRSGTPKRMLVEAIDTFSGSK